MAQRTSQEKEARQVVKAQRREFEAELADNYAQRPRKPRNRRRAVVLVICAVLAVLAIAYTVLLLLPSSTPAPGAGVRVGAAAPSFALAVYGGSGNRGEKITLGGLRGHPVVLNFWSESCIPCRSEVPYLQRTYAQYGANGTFRLLGINQADPKDDIATFGQQFNVSYPLLFDQGGLVNATYNVTAIPTTFFIDSQGVVRYAAVTELSAATMRQGLQAIGVVIPA